MSSNIYNARLQQERADINIIPNKRRHASDKRMPSLYPFCFVQAIRLENAAVICGKFYLPAL